MFNFKKFLITVSFFSISFSYLSFDCVAWPWSWPDCTILCDGCHILDFARDLFCKTNDSRAQHTLIQNNTFIQNNNINILTFNEDKDNVVSSCINNITNFKN